jgi:UDP-3-O-[3-hydroxymyristoyl] N-acetylglucosamine deacetylase/3-hydroxyacyl-[acyl-carrier-protein] dehydratase
MEYQKTIKNPVEYEGIGIHTGAKVVMLFKPADADAGVNFIRVDLPEKPRIPVNANSISYRMRRTSLRHDNGEVNTIEHLMAALNGLGIDNLTIEIDGPELPGGDGSALTYVQLLKQAEIVTQESQKRVFEVKTPIAVAEDDVTLIALPNESGLTISYTLDYNVASVGSQFLSLHVTEETFEREIAPARTFCLSSEVEELQRQGLGKGANYENTLVVGEGGVINNTLRFPDEFVRHKVLDLIGDLFILNAKLHAHVVANKSGHPMNMKLVKKIIEEMRRQEAEQTSRNETSLGIREIQKILPHRYPFLLIDRVIELDGYRRAVGIKNVTYNEAFFQGHFPGQPIMPGVLIFEALSQLAGVLLLRKMENVGKTAVLLSIDKARIRKTVVPGDQLILEAVASKVKSRTGQVSARAKVDGKVVAEAQIRCMLVDT